MPRTLCRGLIATAAILVALGSARSAEAQLFHRSGPYSNTYNAMVTGANYDIWNQQHAEKQLQKVQSRLSSDAARQDPAAYSRDSYRAAMLQHRIQVDEWLIRYNLCQQQGPYPRQVCLDPVSRAAIIDVARPPGAPPTRICDKWYCP